VTTKLQLINIIIIIIIKN